MITYIVTFAVAGSDPSGPPELHTWAVDASSREKAEDAVHQKINLTILAMTARHIDALVAEKLIAPEDGHDVGNG